MYVKVFSTTILSRLKEIISTEYIAKLVKKDKTQREINENDSRWFIYKTGKMM